MSLQKRAKSSLFWVMLENFFIKGFSFFVTIGLTRLLTPKDYGLIGLITVFIALAGVIVESGMGNSIIRDNKCDDVDYSTVFYGNLMLSILVYPIIYIVAPYISIYYEQPILTSLLRVYSIAIIISAFYNIQQNLLIKDLAFKKIVLLGLPGVIIGSLIGLTMAYLGYGVWSIVAMHLCTQLIKAIFIWVKSDWRPIWVFSFLKFKYHFDFGYKLTLSSILDTLVREIYALVIGKLFSISILGYFNQAKAFNNFPVIMITSIVSKVSYPLLSKIKDDSKQVSEIYQGVLRSVFYIITPIMFCLIVIAEPLFTFLFTEKWMGAVPYFKILAFSSILMPIHSFNINVFKIYGRTDLFLKLEIVKVFLVLVAIICAVFWGVYGLLWSIVITSFLGLFINTYYSGRLINYSTLSQLKDIFPVIIIGVISGLISQFITFNLFDLNYKIVEIILGGIMFFTTYLGISILLKNKSMLETYKYFKILIK